MYYSPEIAFGNKFIDSKSDVFSLGLIFAEFLGLLHKSHPRIPLFHEVKFCALI